MRIHDRFCGFCGTLIITSWQDDGVLYDYKPETWKECCKVAHEKGGFTAQECFAIKHDRGIPLATSVHVEVRHTSTTLPKGERGMCFVFNAWEGASKPVIVTPCGGDLIEGLEPGSSLILDYDRATVTFTWFEETKGPYVFGKWKLTYPSFTAAR